MTTPPAKIKAFLATIKETVLDAEECSLQECYMTLLRLEILQRGVLVDEKDPSKILDAVQSTAGKAVIEGSVPKQILAGSAVMAGRCAEKAVQEMILKGRTLENIFDAALVKSAKDRCDEVQEERLKILLHLATPAADDESPVIRQSQLLLIAEGFYYRAAFFQPDVQPMWKRAWDVIRDRKRAILQQQSGSDVDASKDAEAASWEAATALTNLRGITFMKGNSKRAAELSLLLAESLLDAPTQEQNKAFQPTIQAFVAEFRPTEPLSADKRVKEATAALNDSSFEGVELSEDDAFLRAVLKLRIEFASEESDIELQAQEELDLAKNRGKVGVTIVKLRSTVRRKKLAGSVEDSPLDASAQALRDALLVEPLPDVSAERTYRVHLGYALISQYINRQRDLTQAIALAEKGKDKSGRCWLSLAAFVEPILSAFQKKIGWDSIGDHDSRVGCIKAFLDTSSPIEEKEMLEAAAVVVPSIEWMCCARNQNKLVLSLTLLSFTQDVLSVVSNKARKKFKELSSLSVVKSALEAGEQDLLILESALSTTRVLLVLGTGGSGRSIVVAAVTRSDKADSGRLDGEFGSAFLEFLVSWSGIHQSPWQFCRLSEARKQVRKARACLERATSDWGRSASPLETILLDLGEADVEGTCFTGGMIGDARRLYEQVLDAVDQFSELKSVHRDLIRSRCYSGLATLALNHPGSEEFDSVGEVGKEPDDIARMGLDLLQELSLGSEVSPFSLWGSQNATESAIRSQVAKSRQLIADALIRRGSATEAQKFLEDAVQDAPADSGAAFAFGAFRLRMMFFGGERSSVSDKAAQVQLLKAAKLDSSKAGPFALLGFWFESLQDMKRATGCYLKALLLEPGHPVAGRGLLRLKDPDALKAIFDDAINSDSSFNGWAWRAVGLQKALMEDEDELAIVSLLKALRSRDIEHPEAESLAIFFSSPTQPQLTSTEMVEVSAELAACYRRLGRYTAAIRTFHAAIERAGEEAPSSLLCACAQCKLDCIYQLLYLPVITNNIYVFSRSSLQRNLNWDSSTMRWISLRERWKTLTSRCTQWLPMDKVSLVCRWPEEIFWTERRGRRSFMLKRRSRDAMISN
jgi:tetratricopeptide (TPR) repeat protein